MEKKGQIAIFVIIALVIVGAIIVIFAYPQISTLVSPREISPEQYLRECLKPEVKNAVEMLSKQGGYTNPIGYIDYLGDKVKYLCYTSEYYKTCTIQQPMLITHFAEELSKILTPKAKICADNLINEYEKRGFSVSASTITSSVAMASGKIRIEFFAPMTLKMEETSKTFEKFDVFVESEIYELLSIATSIVDYEATFGDSETTTYLSYYPDLKIEKIKLENNIKIYRLTNIITEDMFQFASRSLAWPPGYGLE